MAWHIRGEVVHLRRSERGPQGTERVASAGGGRVHGRTPPPFPQTPPPNLGPWGGAAFSAGPGHALLIGGLCTSTRASAGVPVSVCSGGERGMGVCPPPHLCAFKRLRRERGIQKITEKAQSPPPPPPGPRSGCGCWRPELN